MSNSDVGQGAVGGAAQGAKTGGQLGGPWGAAVGAVLGGLTGGAFGQMTHDKKVQYQNVLNQYMGQLNAIDMPRYADLKLVFEKFQKGEPLSNEELSALQEVDSEVTKIAQDKVAKQSQLDALAAMKARSRGGLTLQDKSDLMQAQREIDRQQSGVQKSIMQNMQARGQGGSGAELAARLNAGQQGAQMASQNSLATAARAQNAAMQSLRDSASLGRQIGQDQMDFDLMKAKAVDDTRRRNLERQQDAMKYNIGNRNVANEANWKRANAIGDENVRLANQEQTANKQLLVDDYYRQMERLNAVYNPQKQQALEKIKDSQNQFAGAMGAIGAIGDMGAGFGGMGGSKPGADKAAKKADPYDAQAMEDMDPYEKQAYKTKYGI